MSFKTEDCYEKAGRTGIDATLEIHRIKTAVYVGAAFFVDWILTGVTNDGNAIGAHLNGFFMRIADGALVPVPADANPIMTHIAGRVAAQTVIAADTDVSAAKLTSTQAAINAITGGLALFADSDITPVLTSAIDGTDLVLSVACADVTTDWYSRAVITGYAA